MNIRPFTQFVSVLAIVALTVGLSVGQLLVAAPAEAEDVERDSCWGCYSSDGTIRVPVWSIHAKWL